MQAIASAILLMLTFLSCDKDDTQNSFYFVPGECSGIIVKKWTCHNPKDKYYKIYSDDVKFSEEDRYCIHIKTLTDSTTKHNELIEKALALKIPSSEEESIFRTVRYRTDICEGLRIYSNIEMFGKTAGTDLASDFVFLSAFGTGDLIVGTDGFNYGHILYFDSVFNYVNSKSFLFVDCFVVPRCYIDTELLTDCKITVEINLNNGKVFSKTIDI